MASSELVLFTVSVLPVILIGLFIYKRDSEKEPLKLLVKLFFGGVGSCFITLLLSYLLQSVIPFFGSDGAGLNEIELIFYVFLGIALVEEFSKWIVAYKISYNDDAFDELYDMVIYCVFVTLGFACFENLFYVYLSGVDTGIKRALLSIPGHTCDGIFMGYYLGLAKLYSLRNEELLKKKCLRYSLLIPIMLHGIYDYCLFVGTSTFMTIFYVFVVCVFAYSLFKILRVSRNNIQFRTSSCCPNCGFRTINGICPRCGNRNNL